MKYSILLPTRNGGPYLRGCIRSVLDQDHADFELVVADNANTDETPAILRELSSDRRIRVVRSERVLSVVDNWNAALAASTGDYLTMLGDDDCLMPGYFACLDAILARVPGAECITSNAYAFVAPGSFEGDDASYYRSGLLTFDRTWPAEVQLSREERFAVVRDMFAFRPRIPLNMQTTVVSRKAANRVPGGMFKAPFPDHYALNALLLLNESWVIARENLVVVGISPKSFGHYVYSHKQDAGLHYLGISTDFPGRLPGSELTNNMHVWLEMLRRDFPEHLRGVDVSRGAYVRRQVYAWVLEQRAGVLPAHELRRRIRLLSFTDMLALIGFVSERATWIHIGRLLGGSGLRGVESSHYGLQKLPGTVCDIVEFVDWLRAAASGSRHQA